MFALTWPIPLLKGQNDSWELSIIDCSAIYEYQPLFPLSDPSSKREEYEKASTQSCLASFLDCSQRKLPFALAKPEHFY